MPYLFCSFPPPWADISFLCYNEKDTFVNETMKFGFDLQGKQLRGVWMVNLRARGRVHQADASCPPPTPRAMHSESCEGIRPVLLRG